MPVLQGRLCFKEALVRCLQPTPMSCTPPIPVCCILPNPLCCIPSQSKTSRKYYKFLCHFYVLRIVRFTAMGSCNIASDLGLGNRTHETLQPKRHALQTCIPCVHAVRWTSTDKFYRWMSSESQSSVSMNQFSELSQAATLIIPYSQLIHLSDYIS